MAGTFSISAKVDRLDPTITIDYRIPLSILAEEQPVEQPNSDFEDIRKEIEHPGGKATVLKENAVAPVKPSGVHFISEEAFGLAADEWTS